MTVRATLPFLLIAFAAFAVAAPQASAAPILDQSFDSNPNGTNFLLGTTGPPDPLINEHAQTFTVGLTGTLAQVDVQLENFGGATGNIALQIQTTTGGAPDGGILASATILNASIAVGSVEPVPFAIVALPAGPAVSTGDVLAIVLLYTGPGSYTWSGMFGDPYGGGQRFTSVNGGAFGVRSTSDLGFQTWVDVPEPSALLLLSLGALVVLRRRRRA